MKKTILCAVLMLMTFEASAVQNTLKCADGESRTLTVSRTFVNSALAEFKIRGQLNVNPSAGIGYGNETQYCHMFIQGSQTQNLAAIAGRPFTLVSADEVYVSHGIQKAGYVFQALGTEDYITMNCRLGSRKHPLKPGAIASGMLAEGANLGYCQKDGAPIENVLDGAGEETLSIN